MRFPAFDPIAFDGDVDGYFELNEAGFLDLTPGVRKRVEWFGEKGAKTPLSVLYLHGFSATSEEVRPVPDQVAAALGANLVYTRLTGHGLPGDAMATAQAADWLADVSEALEAAREVGDEVIVIGTSTGGLLGALAMLDSMQAARVRGLVMLAPIFEFYHRAVRLLSLPLARYWGPLIGGRERSFEVRNAAHGTYWTTQYPSVSVLPLVRLVQHAKRQDFGQAITPGLVIYSKNDTVVLPSATEDMARAWGGPIELRPQTIPPGNDPNEHVIAGDIMSPGMTESVV